MQVMVHLFQLFVQERQLDHLLVSDRWFGLATLYGLVMEQSVDGFVIEEVFAHVFALWTGRFFGSVVVVELVFQTEDLLLEVIEAGGGVGRESALQGGGAFLERVLLPGGIVKSVFSVVVFVT